MINDDVKVKVFTGSGSINFEEDRKESLGAVNEAKELSDQVVNLRSLEDEIEEKEKADLVGDVFDSVSQNYDLMNDLMSFGIHRLWKKIAVETSGLRDNFKVLDLAGGTGDMVKLMRSKISNEGSIFLSDINWSHVFH